MDGEREPVSAMLMARDRWARTEANCWCCWYSSICVVGAIALRFELWIGLRLCVAGLGLGMGRRREGIDEGERGFSYLGMEKG